MAADGLLRSVYEACIAGCDSEIHRRPYHRNCGCALHRRRPHCLHSPSISSSVSYSIRRSWSEGSFPLALALASSSASPSSSPLTRMSSHPAAAFTDVDSATATDGDSSFRLTWI